MDSDPRQTIVDDEHLKLLQWSYLLSGVMTALFSLLGLLYAFMGLMMNSVFTTMAKTGKQAASMPVDSIGAFLGIFGLAFFLVSVSLAIVKFMAAAFIKRRKSRVFCLVVAAISCLGIPYGTVLGVATFIVLGRDSVQRRFAAPPVRALDHLTP
jgi:hypothetical protein